MDAVGSERAAVFGVSEGGNLCALFAAAYPERTTALVIARAVDAVARRLEHLYATKGHATPEEFDAAFDAALGFPPSAPTEMDEQTEKNIRAMMTERLPTEAEIPLARLAAVPFPKLVISGGWSEAFDAICDVLVRELRAERAVFPGTGHGFMVGKGRPLFERLAAFWGQLN